MPLLRHLVLILLAAVIATAAENGGPPSANTGDGVAPRHEAKTANENIGKWQLSIQTSPADGTKTIFAQLAADAPIPSGFAKVTPMLVLRYKAGRPAAYVSFDTYLGSGHIDATIVFGSQPAEEQQWPIAEDGRAAFVPGQALEFMRRLKSAESFSIRVSPHHANAVTASFTTTGVETVIKVLISAGVKFSD